MLTWWALVGVVGLTSWCYCSQPDDPKKIKNYDTGAVGVIKGNRYAYKPEPPKADGNLKSTFILVMHGITPPKPLDGAFGEKWPFHQSTNNGKKLLHMVGRCLRFRYETFLDSLNADSDSIVVTSRSDDHYVTSGGQLKLGLLDKTKHKGVVKDLGGIPDQIRDKNAQVNYDGKDLDTCNWRKTILEELMSELNIPGNSVVLKYCTQDLYNDLKKSLPEDKRPLWDIYDPEKLYGLWKYLWFQVQEAQMISDIFIEDWANIVACVFDFQQLQMAWHPDMAPATIGRMFNQMKQEMEGDAVKLHVHVTDDVTLGWLMWSLPNNDKTLWPDFGDALIFDFLDDRNVKVSSFSGNAAKFVTLGTFPFEELKTHFAERGLDLTAEEHKAVCDFNPSEPN